MVVFSLCIGFGLFAYVHASLQCDATKQWYQEMECCDSSKRGVQTTCNSAKNVDLSFLSSKLDRMHLERANDMGTVASQFVDLNRPCVSNPLEGLFQIYLKRMPTDDEVRRANSSYGYVRISEDVANAFMAKNYPSIVDGTALAGKVFAIVGGSSGWGFTASILLAKYGAKAVYSCARTAAVFEGNKKAAVGSYDEYEADLAKTDAYFSKHRTLSGYTQKYFPMYSGIMGVDPAIFDKIYFSECDVRIASSMVSFFERVKEKAAGQLDAVFFVAGTLGSANLMPRDSVVNLSISVGPQMWTVGGSRTVEQVIALAPNRSSPQIEESPLITQMWGEKNSIDGVVAAYGFEKAQTTRFVFGGSFASTSYGINFAVYTYPLWHEFVSSKQSTMIRYASWLQAGFNIGIIMPGFVLTQNIASVCSVSIENQTAFSPFINRMPTVVNKGYNFIESARIYQQMVQPAWYYFGTVGYADVIVATIVPIAASSSKRGFGIKQVFTSNVNYEPPIRSYSGVQSGGLGMTDAWIQKIGSCASPSAKATEDIETTILTEFNIFGPGPLCLHHQGGPSC